MPSRDTGVIVDVIVAAEQGFDGSQLVEVPDAAAVFAPGTDFLAFEPGGHLLLPDIVVLQDGMWSMQKAGGDACAACGALLVQGIDPIALRALNPDVGGIEADQFPHRLSLGVAQVDGVVAALRSTAIERMPRRAQGVVAGDVIVEQIVIAPGEQPRHTQPFELPDAVFQKLGAAAVRIIVPGVSSDRDQVRFEAVNHPIHVSHAPLVRSGPVPIAAGEEMDVGELEEFDSVCLFYAYRSGVSG
jgi:hypothetical protein